MPHDHEAQGHSLARKRPSPNVALEEKHASRRLTLEKDSAHVTTVEKAKEGLTRGCSVSLTEFEEGIRSNLA